MQYFRDAITDYDTNFQISVSNPKTLDEALLIASRIENFKITHKRRDQYYGDIYKSMNQGQSESEQVNDHDQSCFRSEVAEAVERAMEEQLRGFAEELESIQRDMDLLEERNGMRKPVSAWKKRGVVCFNCDRAGHIAKVCPWFVKGTKNKVVDSGKIFEEHKHKVRSGKVSTKTKPYRCDKVRRINSRQKVVVKVDKYVEVKVEKEGVK